MIDRYSNEYLMQALHFTPDDIAANRQGQLTEVQKERLREKIGKGQTQAIVLVMLVLLFSAIVGGAILFSNEDIGLRESFEQNPTIFILGIGGSLLLYLLMVVFALIRSQRAKSGNFKVGSLEGRVKLSSSEMDYLEARALVSMAGGQTRVCLIEVGRQKIYTDEATFEAFEDGQNYRLYYIGSKPAYVIVSAEVA